MKTIITAHRASLTRAIIALFVLASIAAADPVDNLLESIAAQIEQRATVESGYVAMATIQLRGDSNHSQENVDALKAVQQVYTGRVSAMLEIAGYLRSFGKGGGGGTPVVP